MKIVVCIKQVPDITDVRINPETGTLIREGVASILNPFCEFALDMAAGLKKAAGGGEIAAVSMGPPQARRALLRCLELGADRAVLASDRNFSGADTWATALTLAETIKKTAPGFDLILVGKQAIDGDTAQVGPELAEILGIPQVTYGLAVEITGKKRKKVRVRREIEGGFEVVEARCPALVTVSHGELIRRFPSFSDVLEARSKPYDLITADDLNLPAEALGLTGSLTQVVRIFPPAAREAGRLVVGKEAQTAAEEIVSFLKQERFI